MLNLSPTLKDAYVVMVARILQHYEKYDADKWNRFDRLESIILADSLDDMPDMPCKGAIGCADFRKVWASVFRNFRYDGLVLSMESAHHAAFDHYLEFPNPKYTPNVLANNIIHWAANVGPPYVASEEITFVDLDKLKFQWDAGSGIKWYQYLKALATNKVIKMTVYYYDLVRLFSMDNQIQEQVLSGSAPAGANPYWFGGVKAAAAMPDALKQYIAHYEHDHSEHDH